MYFETLSANNDLQWLLGGLSSTTGVYTFAIEHGYSRDRLSIEKCYWPSLQLRVQRLRIADVITVCPCLKTLSFFDSCFSFVLSFLLAAD